MPDQPIRVPAATLVTSEDLDETLDQAVPDPTPPNQREGLPRSYRMRADKHYVDHLAESPAVAQPVRMLRLEQLEDEPRADEVDLRPLIESIRAQGVVHPLLVRVGDGRFSVIAGHRRLAAARILRLPAVPCLVHDLDDKEALALAQADNLRLASPHEDADPSSLPAAVRQAIAHHVFAIHKCTELLTVRHTVLARAVGDLIAAHAWRASRLNDALDLVTNAALRPTRHRALATIVDELIEGFAPESRLNGVTMQAQIGEGLSSSGLNDHELFAGLSGALLSVLPFAEEAEQSTIFIRAHAADQGSLVIEIVQPHASITASAARRFFDETADMRAGGTGAILGSLAAKTLAERYGGTAKIEPTPPGGHTLRLAVTRRS